MSNAELKELLRRSDTGTIKQLSVEAGYQVDPADPQKFIQSGRAVLRTRYLGGMGDIIIMFDTFTEAYEFLNELKQMHRVE